MSDISELYRECDALETENKRLREALKMTVPHLQEGFRWHRDMQSSTGRILAIDNVLAKVTAALNPPKSAKDIDMERRGWPTEDTP